MRNYNWLFLTRLLAVLAACTGRETGAVQWRGLHFREARSIQSLPTHIQNALGVGQPGLDGIADQNGQFNATDVVDSALPRRRFALAGLSSDAVLVAIEQGGRGYNVQVSFIPLASKDAKPSETWTLFKKPESLRALVEQLEKQKNEQPGTSVTKKSGDIGNSN